MSKWKTSPALKWWPKQLPVEMIPGLAEMGKRKIIYDNFEKCADGHVRATVTFNGCNCTDDELNIRKLMIDCPAYSAEILLMAGILGNGVKQFTLPANMWTFLQDIAIPFECTEYVQPFPALVVQLPDGSYHLVEQRNGLLTIFEFKDDYADWLTCAPGKTIEEYLISSEVSEWRKKDGGIRQEIIETDESWRTHKFRATLNFLLLCCAEGVLCEGKLTTDRVHGVNHITKLANPDVYRPQDISLFRTHYVGRESIGEGNGKRPHWRRLHWRRVSCGIGRTERKLTLIKSVFVNKDRLKTEIADTEYIAK